MERVTRVLTTGVTRGSLHFTEVQESQKASGGIYEGGGERGTAAGLEVRDGVDSCAVLKTAHLENQRQRRRILNEFRTDALPPLLSNFSQSQHAASGQYSKRLLMFSFLSHV